ncbi:MAG TPA: lipoyl domain-containing protein [Phenylobacterium sp.]|uniref:lipoyl domain-containing protein n=1 Tax=Phenylobacterium sp. TaxID=1871053 RepID=UPI002B487B93|nr:lipoyl domain-containing protein [Phenylobacterium sp.]HKR87466.1 lipoyl domain-containing protein [Phenylobacterium sp.]HKT54149.1 lipoyl domain-containing protein [Caulobacteraceae bacterium]
MSTILTIPQLEMAMSEGGLAEWLAADGAQVAEGDPIYVLETGKAAQDIAAPVAGRLIHRAAAGAVYPVGAEIGAIE